MRDSSKRNDKLFRARMLLPLCATALLAACSTGPGSFNWRPEKPIGFPQNDPQPRVTVDFGYHSSKDVDRSFGFFASIGNFLFGAEEHELVGPYGLCLRGDHELLIADTGRSVIHLLDLESCEHRVLEGNAEHKLQTPIGVACDNEGRIYVSNSASSTIVVFNAAGKPVASFGSPEETGRPTGIVFDPVQDRLLVLDTTGGRILEYSRSGNLLKAHGKRGTKAGEFNFPTSIAIGPEGKIYVSDSMNFRIQVLSRDFEPLKSFGIVGRGPGTFASPKGIAVDSEGHIYVVDGMFDNVQIFDGSGRLLLAFCSRGTELGQLYLPKGIFIDAKDRIFIADGGNARIQVMHFHARGKGALR